MATPTPPAALPKWLVDVALVGIGVALVGFGSIGNGTFGDGETVGAGLLAIGAGVRGLIAQA